MASFSNSYRDSGVDVAAGYKAVELMKKHVARTVTPGVVDGIGGFGGLFRPQFGSMKSPMLVSGTDGVGTKLKIAFLMGKHNTVGIDCVAMCVNDVVCSGAAPLFFLDYLAVGKNKPERVEEIVSGVAEGCVQAGCALIGGETAEMPDFYPVDEYDLAGFCVGMVDEEKIIDGKKNIKVGDVLIGIASSGLHSNGFSLVRKVFRVNESNIRLYLDDLGKTLGEELITPTRIYVKSILKLIEDCNIHGIANITGGGFYENIPRMFSDGLEAKVETAAVRVHPVFKVIQSMSNISQRDMFNTFNMGVGMVVAVAKEDVDKAIASLQASGETAYVIGEVAEGTEGVTML
ncbi:MAG: phosphoribosylformylglycinamidine cyclo-ligase [Ruminococcaceae bacterium]|nr:phosphoribosylformylglycinamidine cyclo-ligase [Oscillospiraceae bacterium]